MAHTALTGMQQPYFFTRILLSSLISGIAATAQAEGNVTLYGVIDTGLAYTSKQGTRPSLLGGGLSDSLWGLRGIEEINNDLNVSFRLENGFNPVTGKMNEDSRFFDYESWIGLTHKTFGKLQLGRQHTIGQQFGSALEIASWKEFGLGATFKASDNFQLDKVVSYLSPNLYGIQAGIGYSFDAQSTSNSSTQKGYREISAGLRYSQEPFYAALTYDQLELDHQQISGPLKSPEAWQAGASYDFEIMKISVAWSRQKNGFIGLNAANFPDSSDPAVAAGMGQPELVHGGRIDSWYLGSSIPAGKGEIQVQWSLSSPSWHTDENGKPIKNAWVYSIGYIYPLSVRIRLYTFFGQMHHMKIDGTIVSQGSPLNRIAAGINYIF